MLTTPPELMARLINLIVGALPACGCLSLVMLTVAVHACPAFATDGLPASAMLRSLASAAGTQMRAASAVKTMSLRMLFLLRCLFYTTSAAQVPQEAESGQRARTRTPRRRNSIDTDAALFA
jgi:hypothetical protein